MTFYKTTLHKMETDFERQNSDSFTQIFKGKRTEVLFEMVILRYCIN